MVELGRVIWMILKIKNGCFIQGVLLFLYLNNISFTFNPSITTSRIVFLCLLFYAFLFGMFRRFDKNQLCLIYLCIFLSVLNLILSLHGDGDTTQFSRFLHFAFFSLLTPIIYVRLFKDEIQFHKAIVAATVYQIVFVFITYSSPFANEIIFSYVFVSHDFLTNLGRAPGLSSSGGATLSLVISFGAFSILRLAILRKSPWHLLVMILICFSQVLVGRTGLILSLFCLILLFYYSNFDMKSILLSLIGVALSTILAIDFLLKNEQFLAYTLIWAKSIFTAEDKTMSALLSMGIEYMNNIDLIFGTGQVALQNGLNASGSDIGYIQTFYATGLFGLIFYLSLFTYLFSYFIKTRDKSLFLIFLFLPFVVEIKEPFIFKYMVVFFVTTSLLYGSKYEYR